MLPESHRTEHIGWLRAAVLGANDGIVSTASLIVGVAAANANPQNILITAASGLVAGAMSMAAGEYVSVSSQADTESADLLREREELAADPEFEQLELAQVYEARGLDAKLAAEVSRQLMNHDALGSHLRDELGISEMAKARPIQAALASAAAFTAGAALPLATAFAAPVHNISWLVSGASLFFLAILGIVSAKVGGANAWKAASRVVFWGALAMAITAGVGLFFGVAI